MFVPFTRAEGELLFDLLSGAWGVKVSYLAGYSQS